MPDVASPQVTVPTDGVRSLRRPAMPRPKSDQAADADFGKQLANMATGDERPARSAGAKEGREPPASGWRQWGAKFVPPRWRSRRCAGGRRRKGRGHRRGRARGGRRTASRRSGRGRRRPCGGCGFPNCPPPGSSRGSGRASAAGRYEYRSGAGGTDFSACRRRGGVAPTRSPGDRSGALHRAQRHPRRSRPRALPPRRVPPQMVQAPCPRSRKAPPQTQPASCKETPTSTVQGVSVIRRETHLAPSMPPPAPRQGTGRVAAEATSRDAQVSADAVGAPAEEATPSDPPSHRGRGAQQGWRPMAGAGIARQDSGSAGRIASASPGSRGGFAAAGRACRGRRPQCSAGQPKRRHIRRSRPRGAAAGSAAVFAGAADRRQDRGGHCTHRASIGAPIPSSLCRQPRRRSRSRC